VTAWLRVEPADPTPPYEQLRRQIATLIATGALADGERLPPVRQLAADLGLAAGTVARTYRELETEGLVATRRAAGTRVMRPDATTRSAEGAAERVVEFVRGELARGTTPEHLLAAVRRALDRVNEASG
jgi:DNA-binding transcriptional regulator YhcF (GntR family)